MQKPIQGYDETSLGCLYKKKNKFKDVPKRAEICLSVILKYFKTNRRI